MPLIDLPLRLAAASLASFLLATNADARTLRVCADPNNLPFSNARGEGLENKIAELLAEELGASSDVCLVGPAPGLHPKYAERRRL